MLPQVELVSASSRPIGVNAGDQAVYRYEIRTSFETETDNRSSTAMFNVTVGVLAVNTTGALAAIHFINRQEPIIGGVVNTSASTVASNLTYVYDPFNNETYLGKLGFPAFAYTDLQNGTRSFQLTVPVESPPDFVEANASTPHQTIAVSVTRTTSLITVSLNDTLAEGASPAVTAVQKYDPATGVLQSMRLHFRLLDVSRWFLYTLLSFSPGPPASPLWWIPYAIVATAGGAIAIWVALPYRKGKKADRMRERFGRKK
ncbi:MAG: hypothetical protein HY296_01265 [Thaumarchaeota archaeon]|nr:hypothetical protein [Nitrososphaerota archaeon]